MLIHWYTCMIVKFAIDLLKEAAFECELSENKELSSELVDVIDFLIESSELEQYDA